MRYCALQNVTLNLPRIAYLSKGDDTQLFSKITETIEMAVRAHLEKKNFIGKLLSLGEKGPLALLAMNRDGSPYLRMQRASFLIGMVGLNEMVQIHTGQELHQSKQAFKFGLKVIAHMKLMVEKLSERYGMRFVLEQTPLNRPPIALLNWTSNTIPRNRDISSREMSQEAKSITQTPPT